MGEAPVAAAAPGEGVGLSLNASTHSTTLRLVLRTQPRSQSVPREGEDASCPARGRPRPQPPSQADGVGKFPPTSLIIAAAGEDARCPEQGNGTDWPAWLEWVVEREGVIKSLTVRNLILASTVPKQVSTYSMCPGSGRLGQPSLTASLNWRIATPKHYRCAENIQHRAHDMPLRFRRRDANGCDRDGRAPPRSWARGS